MPDGIESSEQWWVTKNRDWLLAGLGAVALTWLLARRDDHNGAAVAGRPQMIG